MARGRSSGPSSTTPLRAAWLRRSGGRIGPGGRRLRGPADPPPEPVRELSAARRASLATVGRLGGAIAEVVELLPGQASCLLILAVESILELPPLRRLLVASLPELLGGVARHPQRSDDFIGSDRHRRSLASDSREVQAHAPSQAAKLIEALLQIGVARCAQLKIREQDGVAMTAHSGLRGLEATKRRQHLHRRRREVARDREHSFSELALALSARGDDGRGRARTQDTGDDGHNISAHRGLTGAAAPCFDWRPQRVTPARLEVIRASFSPVGSNPAVPRRRRPSCEIHPRSHTRASRIVRCRRGGVSRRLGSAATHDGRTPRRRAGPRLGRTPCRWGRPRATPMWRAGRRPAARSPRRRSW